MTEVIKTVKNLKVYDKSFELANRIFEISQQFPREETYSLIDQVRRSSRSVAINIREGFAKRRYKQVFLRHLNDSLGSSEETRGWLEFALRSNYLSQEIFNELDGAYDELNAMIYNLIQKWN